VSKKGGLGQGKGGLECEEGGGKEGEKGRVGGTEQGGKTHGVGRSGPGHQSKGCRQTKETQRKHTMQNEQQHMEILSKAGKGIGSISRASKAETTGLIRTKAIGPGSHCGRR